MNFDPSLHLTMLLCVLAVVLAATVVLLHRQSIQLRVERLKAECAAGDRAIEQRLIVSGTLREPEREEFSRSHHGSRLRVPESMPEARARIVP